MGIACWIIGGVVLVGVLSWLLPDLADGEIRMALRRKEERGCVEKVEQLEADIAALKAIHEDAGFKTEGMLAVGNKLNRLEAEIERLKEENRWIPVSKDTPKNSKPVQVVEFSKIKEGYYNGQQFFVWAGNAWCISNNVTHWKPIILPEPAAGKSWSSNLVMLSASKAGKDK